MKKIKVTLKVLIFIFSFILIGANAAQAYEIGPKITFTFDDGAKRIFENAAPILKMYNMPAVLYGETGSFNSGGSWAMSWDQIRKLQNENGWEIGSHSINHSHLTMLNGTDLYNEVVTSKADFLREGIKVKSFASPYGEYNNTTMKLISQNYESHRGAWGGPNIWPSTYNSYEIVSEEIKNTTTLAEVKAWVDDAIMKKQWLVFLLHDIVKGEPLMYEYNVDKFAEIVAYISSKGVEVTTISNGLKYSDQPNLINNYSFSNLSSNKWAQSWLRNNSEIVTIDTVNNGDVFGPVNSLKIKVGSSRGMVTSEVMPINSNLEYMLRMFQKVEDYKSGGWAVWVDEFGDKGNWLSGKWLGGNYGNFFGEKYYVYLSNSTNVKNIQITIYTEDNSNFTLYIDSVFFNAISKGLDIISPVITLSGESNINLLVGDKYIEAGARAVDNVDGDISNSIIIGGDTVDTSKIGNYVLNYSVVDSAGNKAIIKYRTVKVSSGNTDENLVKNYSFEIINGTFVQDWKRNNAVKVVVDVNNNGYGEYPKNSLKIIGGLWFNSVESSVIEISGASMLSFYEKIDKYVNGGTAVWIDEYDENGEWLSGVWLGGSYEPGAGVKSYLYTPSASKVAKVKINFFAEEGSSLEAYYDDIKFISK